MFAHNLLLERMRRDLDRSFREFYGDENVISSFHSTTPPVNIWTGEDDLLVTAETPGIDPEKLDIAVEGDVLTIRGEREEQKLSKDAAVLREEISAGSFVRTIQLPFRVDSDKVSAGYSRGILRITLPRAPEDKPKKISVKVS